MTDEKVEIFKVTRYFEDGYAKYSMVIHDDARVMEIEEIVRALAELLDERD